MSDLAETVELKTPGGKTVVIRAYTTHSDDRQAEEVLYGGTSMTSDAKGEPTLSISPAAAVASEYKYVELLVQSIDGDSSDISRQLDALRSDDYAAVLARVKEIAGDPKADSKS